MSATAERPARLVTFQLPRKLAFLLEMHPYKIAYGGRNGLKSRAFSGALLTLGIHQSLRIMCVREIQETLRDSSHQLLCDQIKRLGYEREYAITEEAIRSRINDTLFRFRGLSDLTVESAAKGLEGLDIIWADEMQAIKRRSFQIVLPTLFRTPNSEFWGCFNPILSTDESWQRFVVNPPPGARVVETNYRDAIACGWWSDRQEELRKYDLQHFPLDYDNIWEGRPRSFAPGAIYGREVTEMEREKRFRPVPYDPRLPVHRIWDLGWNDLMTVVMVQKPVASAITIINYIEEKFVTYPDLLQTMSGLRYRWGTDWMPHDAAHHHPTSGTNAKKQLEGLGCKVRLIPRSDPEARIRAARMMFPRVYMDNSKRDTPPERPDQALGAEHLMGRLKRYKRTVLKTTNEPGEPLHDIESHGADAFGALAEIVDQIRNEGDMPRITVAPYVNSDPGMGLLG